MELNSDVPVRVTTFIHDLKENKTIIVESVTYPEHLRFKGELATHYLTPYESLCPERILEMIQQRAAYLEKIDHAIADTCIIITYRWQPEY